MIKKNKPVPLSEKVLKNSGIVGSASQKWCLFRILPFLVAHRIPEDSSYWRVYLLCREIADIVMAPAVKKESLPLLDQLVSEFLLSMTEQFGSVVTPKCHYLIHYSRLMLSYGPLHSLWCMRFEGKHQYFKHVASTCRIFLNISSTLSNRHQYRQCWEFSSANMLGEYEKVTGSNVGIPFRSLPSALQDSLSTSEKYSDVNFEEKTLQRVTEVVINNVKYSVKDVFVVGHVHSENIPLFFQIKYIVNIDTDWALCGKLLIPGSFCYHYYSYWVKYDNNWSVLSPGEETDHQALDTYTVDDRLFVNIRYSL